MRARPARSRGWSSWRTGGATRPRRPPWRSATEGNPTGAWTSFWRTGDVDRVYATTRTALHTIAVEDTAVACLEFANGAVGTLEATTAAFPGLPRRVELTGSEGTIVVERDRVVSVQLRTPVHAPPHEEGTTNASSTSPVVSDIRGHRRVLENFVAAINAGTALLCDGREGRRSVALVEAMYRSARTGAAVVLRGAEGVLDALER